MIRIVSIITVLISLASCSGSPIRVSMMSDQELKTQPSDTLCNAYHYNQAEPVKSELNNRELLTAKEWKQIDRKKVIVGMSELALICARGFPSRINKTVLGNKKVKQYVYRSYSKSQYIYIRKGIVISWQS